MKKLKGIFFWSLLLIVLSPITTKALTYNVNDVDYELNENNVLDYCYYNYVKNTYDNLIVFTNGMNNYGCLTFSTFEKVSYYTSSYNSITLNTRGNKNTFVSWTFNEDFSTSSYSSVSSYSFTFKSIIYTNLDIYENKNSSTIYTSSNFTFNDIESRYIIEEPIEEPIEEDTDKITRNDFYALLVMFGILIMMLFLKWLFPFRIGE